MSEKMSYEDSGVNINEGNRFVQKIKHIMGQYKRRENLTGIGGFGGTFDISALGMKHPVLVSSIDGVGTKLTVAHMMNKHDTVGEDIVNHCINDIMVQGAKPLFFTDYIGCGRLNADLMAQVIEGMVRACKASDCELLGGETAEMPGMYQPGDYDLVGSITGVVEKDELITGEKIGKGDVVISMPSSGLHTNGYSLARKILFEKMKFSVNQIFPELGHKSLGEVLLVPHRCYSQIMLQLMKEISVHGFAHITGGGMTENIPRILPSDVSVSINIADLDVPPVFSLLRKWGNVEESEMLRVFNMGVGMIVIVSKEETKKVLEICQSTWPGSKIIGTVIDEPGKKVIYA